MNYIITEEKLIDYLYGEMDPAEVNQFEKALAQSPQWQKELSELQTVQHVMREVHDEMPRQQIIIKEHIQKKPLNLRWLRPIGAIAAALAFLIMIGSIVGMQIDQYDGGMAISFGKTKHAVGSEFTDDQIQRLVGDILDQRDQQWSQQFASWQQDLKNEVKTQEASLEEVAIQVKNINKKPDNNFVTVHEMNQVLQNQRREDQETYEKMVANLFEYLALSREKDLQMIQQGFDDVKQYINLSELERNKILASYQENYLNQ